LFLLFKAISPILEQVIFPSLQHLLHPREQVRVVDPSKSQVPPTLPVQGQLQQVAFPSSLRINNDLKPGKQSLPVSTVVTSQKKEVGNGKEVEKNGIRFLNRFYPIPSTVSSSDKEKNNLILGIATLLDPKYIAIFAASLRLRAKSKATVVLLIDSSSISPLVRQLSQKYQLLLLDFQWKELQPTFLQKYHPSSIRWICFHRLLQENSLFFDHWYQSVLTVDVRDTTFQFDPFPLIPMNNNSSPLLVFGENQEMKIRDCGWNSAWIRDCFGDQKLNSVGDHFIVCSGISMGSLSVMKRYMEIMNNILLGLQPLATSDTGTGKDPPSDPSTRFPSCERNGVDQGIHNYLVYSGLFPLPITIHYPDSFPVINLQSSLELYLPSTRDPSTIDMIPPQKGQFAIVHQYDRNNELQLKLAEKYVDWIDWKSPNNIEKEWKQTSECSDYFSYLSDVDMFRGQCDVGVARVMTAASCCAVCVQRGRNFQQKLGLDNGVGQQQTKDCTAFTYLGGVCYLKDCRNDILRDKEFAVKSAKKNIQSLKTSRLYESGAVSGFLKA
jgi:hypothetical protein